jgi:DNA-binding transcriptional MerR regulator
MRIGELAQATGVTAKTLRYYETEGLLAPARAPNGYRDYPTSAVDRVLFVRHAQAAGLTLRQIREVLAVRDGGKAPCRHVAGLVADRLDEVEQRLRELRATRTQLVGLQRRLAELDPADCEPTAICSAVTPA